MNHFLSVSASDISEVTGELGMALFVSAQVICYLLEILQDVLLQSNRAGFLFSYNY